MAFRDSINDLMFRFYERFKQNNHRLPVDVGAQVATESTLAVAVSRLNAILTRLEGTLDVDVGGQIHADVDLGDVTVQLGEVQQGKRGQNAEPWEVTLQGRIVAKSTDPKPPGQNGDILIWWDTKQVWLHDGTDWREW